MKEALIDRQFAVPTHDQATEVLQPGKGPFYRPSSSVTPQFAAVVVSTFLVVLAIRADQFDPASGQSLPQRIAVVVLVGDDPIRIFSRATPIFSIVVSSKVTSLGEAESR